MKMFSNIEQIEKVYKFQVGSLIKKYSNLNGKSLEMKQEKTQKFIEEKKQKEGKKNEIKQKNKEKHQLQMSKLLNELN
eukprot:CAMPEP_0170557162 /NCGR_PEP_ID=MMETSP0211-20121228/19243_1 /TAXON_ID=311385 /ORGANISM="Pseudokeronopsis sp., Strain OXSARD2" /LENGTH=77 /DNA_ID=CAMNT_0010867909 /DNA_START=1035 /DNA_END=1268 /DNA_ORIENTATION=+